MEFFYLLDSRFRGNDRQAPSPGLVEGQASFCRRGRGGWFIRLKCYLN